MTDHSHDSEFTLRDLVQRIAERVRPVCTHMPEDQFRALVEQMARVEQKYIHYPQDVPRELRGDNAS
jgi:hypothetical protein